MQVDALELNVEGKVQARFGFGGSLGLKVAAGGVEIQPLGAFTFVANVAGTVADTDGSGPITGRLGFVDVSATNPSLDIGGSAAVSLSCTPAAASCSPSALTATAAAPTGHAILKLPEISIAQGSSPLVLADPNLLNLDWDLATTAPPVPTGTFATAGIPNFSNVSFANVATGLQFLAGWLKNAEGIDAMSTTIPLVGKSLSDLTATADQIQAKVKQVTDAVEAHAELTGPSAPKFKQPSAEETVQLLCNAGLVTPPGLTVPPTPAQCAALMSPLSLDPHTIEYTVDLSLPAVLFGPGGILPAPQLDLALGDASHDALTGLSLSAQSGTWTGGREHRRDVHARPEARPEDSVLAPQLGFNTPGDLDEDGIADASDPDRDGDGVPEHDTLAAGDLCSGLAASLHVTEADLRAANANAAPGACDLLVHSGTTLNRPGATVTTVLLTDETACLALAQVHAIALDPFLRMNSYLDSTGQGDPTVCAPAISSSGGYTYDVDVTPVGIANRIYIKAGGSTPIIDASLNVHADDVGAAATLGFLDLAVLGDLSADPGVKITLSDPGTSSRTARSTLPSSRRPPTPATWTPS